MYYYILTMERNKISRKPKYVPPTSVKIDNQNKEGFLSSAISNVFQGITLGFGSQLATRALDSIMGPRKIELKTDNNTNCNNEFEAYCNCMKNNSDNYSYCKVYFELLSKCKNTN
jgi:coiled-coil-helix-coiled-coil-helix domain-containing protein 10